MGCADEAWQEHRSSRPQTSNGKDCPASTKSRVSDDTLKITAEGPRDGARSRADRDVSTVMVGTVTYFAGADAAALLPVLVSELVVRVGPTRSRGFFYSRVERSASSAIDLISTSAALHVCVLAQVAGQTTN